MLRAGRDLTIGTLIALAALLCCSDSSPASLAERFAAGQNRASRLQHAIQGDSALIRGYESRIGNLEARLIVVERSVEAQERLLNQVNLELGAARETLRTTAWGEEPVIAARLDELGRVLTPGLEGVPESTLARFCLTRPFAGPREADHIQAL